MIVYEQQSWEGEIIDERDMKQGRGRPRKQHVRWKPSWVDGGPLTAPQNWRKKAMLTDHRPVFLTHQTYKRILRAGSVGK